MSLDDVALHASCPCNTNCVHHLSSRRKRPRNRNLRGRMSVEWTSSEPRNFLSKGKQSPRFCYRPPVCVGFGNFSPLGDFSFGPLFRTDAHPHVPVRHRTDGRVQVRAQRGSVRLAATSAAGRWSCPCARRRRCSGTSSRSARELVPCRAAASLKRSPRVARARLVRGRADRRLADERRVQAG